MRRSPELDLPHVLVAAATSSASAKVARMLGDAGYVVSTTLVGADVIRDLRTHVGIELLVLDGSETPSVAAEIIGAVRALNWALPIILVARPDPDLRAEAQRQGVEAILEAPVIAEDLRRVSTAIAPVVPEAELDLAG